MKRILLHPVTLCLLFCFLIISGESTAYFYIVLLLMGLTAGALHSFLGVAGIAFLLSTIRLEKKKLVYWCRLFGALCLGLSLLRFFTQPRGSYNFNTFRESVPLVLIIIFALLLIFFLINLLMFLISKKESTIRG